VKGKGKGKAKAETEDDVKGIDSMRSLPIRSRGRSISTSLVYQ